MLKANKLTTLLGGLLLLSSAEKHGNGALAK